MSRQGSAGAERPPQEHYLAATATELKIATVPRRFAAVADARLLFPHSGSIEVTHDVLELRGWRTLRAREIAIVSRAYIPEYNRLRRAAFVAGSRRLVRCDVRARLLSWTCETASGSCCSLVATSCPE